MNVPRLSSPVGCPPGDLNLWRRPPQLDDTSGDQRHFADIVALSPWRLESKLGPWFYWVFPPLQLTCQPEAALGLAWVLPPSPLTQ